VSLPEEGDRLAGALRAALAQPDPVERYRALTKVQDQFDAMVSAIKLARGEVLAELKVGRSYQAVAGLVDVRRYQAVQDLITASRAAKEAESRQTNTARAAQREDKTVTTTTNLGSFGRYTHSDTPKDMVLDFLADQADSFDVDGLVDAFRDAINAELAESGIALRGREFYGPYPAPEDTTELIDAAIVAVDLGELAATYDNTLEEQQ
jgi:hypothetical protein